MARDKSVGHIGKTLCLDPGLFLLLNADYGWLADFNSPRYFM
jgi:hypothetical protein